jgi:hypothetical protein
MSTRKQTDLQKLMNRRGVGPRALAAVTRIAVADVEAFRRGDAAPTREQSYLTERALDDSYRARLALDAVHRRRTLPLAGEGAAQLGLKPTRSADGAGVLDGGRAE